MSGVDELLERARAGLTRVPPERLRAEHEAGAWVIDIRPQAQRDEHGEIDFATVIERNVLEWRLDPTSEAALPEASRDARIVVVCQQGYASSLAAATLQQLGIARATDLIGGYDAWREAEDGA
ncbi:rhodanese-like domain-containing protein [Naumannella huperziae]